MNWYNQSWQQVQEMPLEKGWALIRNISRIDGLYHGEATPQSGSRGQLQPGQMGTPAQVAAMVARIAKENEAGGKPFDPKTEVMIDGKRHTISKRR